jgi:heme-degrading monooxygenase HmoA
MHARVTSSQATPEQLEQGIAKFREQIQPELAKLEGYRGAYLLVDRASGKVVNISLWESEATMLSSALPAAGLRSQLAPAFGAVGEPSIENFEVVLQPSEGEGERLASAVAAAARELEGQVRRVASSEEVTKLSRQVEGSLRAFAEWARNRGGPPGGGAAGSA